MSGVVAQGVRRSFGAVDAVVDATFHAMPGRITGLVGPNGAGKTTLLLMLASLLAPDAGRIGVEGVDPVEDPAAVRRMLGWMPDTLGAWPSLTARESIVTTARLHDMPAADAAARADELLALVGLASHAGSPARVLSRGQKQKLGLARALVHRPGCCCWTSRRQGSTRRRGCTCVSCCATWPRREPPSSSPATCSPSSRR